MAQKPIGNQRFFFFSFFIIFNRFSGHNVRFDNDIFTILYQLTDQFISFAMMYSLFFWMAGGARWI